GGRFPKTSGRPRRRSVLRRRPVGALPPPYYEAPRRWLGARTSPRIPAVQVPPTPPPGDTRPHRAARHLRPTRLGTGRDCTGPRHRVALSRRSLHEQPEIEVWAPRFTKRDPIVVGPALRVVAAIRPLVLPR